MNRTSLPPKKRLRRFILCYWNSWSPTPEAAIPIAHRIDEDLVGTEAPEFVLRDVDGAVVRSQDYLGRLPVVIEFGSVT